MQKLNRPNDYDVLWAQATTKADITNKRVIGWEIEIPEKEDMNALQYRQDYAIAYILQNGVADYDPNSTYYTGQLVNVSGVLYKAITQTAGTHPVTGNFRGDYWEKFAPTWADFTSLLNRIDSADPFTQYIRKANPVIDINWVGAGLKSVLDQNHGITFSADAINFVNGNTILAKIPKILPTLDDSSTTLATTKWVQDLIRQLRVSLEISVNESIITTNAQNPAVYKGYGVWVLDCQGRSIVGVGQDPNLPEWVKTIGGTAGEYTTTLTLAQLPTHNHYTDQRFNKLAAIAGDVYGDISIRQTTASSHDYGNMEEEMGIGTITALGKQLMSIKDAGSGQAHNNTQPSQTKYIWTRIS